jgi:RNA recognition motif-containing protein
LIDLSEHKEEFTIVYIKTCRSTFELKTIIASLGAMLGEERPNRRPVFDCRFEVKLAKPCYQVFVGGIPWRATEEDVRALFEKCGKVVSVIVPITRSGRTSGSAYVSFANARDAEKAISTLNNTEWQGRILWVEEKRNGQRNYRGDIGYGDPEERDGDRREQRYQHERERRHGPPDEERYRRYDETPDDFGRREYGVRYSH